ncbi:MAG: Mrp/NBP35 family ATP-binding protein [Flavobacteriales bacterium]|nr:Mrp/NBP35 family ATP-binding protein [Flavobacteriales bacterium]
MATLTKADILEALSGVVEPELGKDIVTLDLAEVVSLEDRAGQWQARVRVKSSSPAMHARQRMREAVEFALEKLANKTALALSVEVEVVPIGTNERTVETRKVLPGVKHIIAIASGKGGVGKSTVTANLAVELARRGHRVGLVDADIHGPSMPTMFDVVREKPLPVERAGKSMIGPVEAHGVKMLSIGFFADPDQAIVWRGPMAAKALGQLFTDGDWGELDYMLIDLPPGTGDVHLSLVQLVPLSGVVVVSTPQDIALADARKGVSMFQLESINVPVLGLVENMAYFSPPDLPDRKYHLFGRDGVKRYAEASDTPFLGELPLVQAIREAGDAGRPAALQEGTESARAIAALTDRMLEVLADQPARAAVPTSPA